MVLFQRNRAQREFNLQKHNRNIILKSRQLGFTTDEVLDELDDTLFTRNFDSLLISYDKESALDIFDNKVTLAWEHFGDGVIKDLDFKKLYSVDTDRANKYKFGFGDGTYSSISVKNEARSGTYHRVHISEFARICKKYPIKAKEIVEGTIPSVPLEGRIDIESTADGEQGSFHKMFWDAWNRGRPPKVTEFRAHFFNWTYDDAEIAKVLLAEKDLPSEFRDIQKLHRLTDIQITYYYYKWLGLEKNFNALFQEYPTTPEEAFIYSGSKLFDPKKIDAMKRFCKAGRVVGDWTYYEDYRPGHVYALGADVAEGVGQDSSTIAIWDFTNRPRIVAEYASNKIPPDTFAYEVKNGGQAYGHCLAAVERNNHGHTTLAILKGMYKNVYAEITTDKITNQKTEKLGWHTNLASKPKMFYEFNTAINEELIDIPSQRILSEARAYDKDELNVTRFDEEQTNHFDLLTAAVIGFQMKTMPKSVQTTVRIHNRHLNKQALNLAKHLPVAY